MLIRKRKLTKNQARRIKDGSETNLDDDRLAQGVIVSHFGRQLDVQIVNIGEQHVLKHQIYRCHTRTNLPLLTVNDKVLLSFDEVAQLGRIEKLLPRASLITRPDRYHKIKPVAADVDLLVIVFAVLPKATMNLIDRYLLISHITKIPALLVLNKTDLWIDGELKDKEACHQSQKIFNQYKGLGYDIISTAKDDKRSFDILSQKIAGKISIFAGQSGVGKSSLINQLLPNANQSTNIISAGSKLGQHTTTASRLLPFDHHDLTQGGIIDTPGIREYGIWHLSHDDVLGAFFELAPLSGQCRFRDCKHTNNSLGCALWQAYQEGRVLDWRINNLIELQSEALPSGTYTKKFDT